jgi:hypothetical protein
MKPLLKSAVADDRTTPRACGRAGAGQNLGSATLQTLLEERQTWLERIALATCGRPTDAGTRDRLFAVEQRLDDAYPGWLDALYANNAARRA